MNALELRAPRPVILTMAPRPSARKARLATVSRTRPVYKVLIAAFALSALVHGLWSFWPVDTLIEPEGAVLTATLTEMPPPPLPVAQPAPEVPSPGTRPTRAKPRPRAAVPPAAPAAPYVGAPDAATDVAQGAAAEARSGEDAPAVAAATAGEDSSGQLPASPVALPPRVELAYKVFLGTRGFLIGDATYRFEHDGDRYRISTVGQARGLAALLVRGTGKVESRGRITADGLRPYEFAIERGSVDRREVAFFDWDAGNVVLQDGATAPLEPPTFDPLTILWQPYFSPPGKGEQRFGLATTRKVARYKLTMQAEETIAWRRGDIVTERWHQRSDDGNTEAWFWLAPSMHYIPVKMRVTRTSRGTLEVLLDAIRADEGEAFGLTSDATDADAAAQADAEASRTVDDVTFGMPGTALPPRTTEDLRGQ
jgi:hypothetical protein